MRPSSNLCQYAVGIVDEEKVVTFRGDSVVTKGICHKQKGDRSHRVLFAIVRMESKRIPKKMVDHLKIVSTRFIRQSQRIVPSQFEKRRASIRLGVFLVTASTRW